MLPESLLELQKVKIANIIIKIFKILTFVSSLSISLILKVSHLLIRGII